LEKINVQTRGEGLEDKTSKETAYWGIHFKCWGERRRITEALFAKIKWDIAS